MPVRAQPRSKNLAVVIQMPQIFIADLSQKRIPVEHAFIQETILNLLFTHRRCSNIVEKRPRQLFSR